MVRLCKMIISPGDFFHFFKILILWVARGGGGDKRLKNSPKYVRVNPDLDPRQKFITYWSNAKLNDITGQMRM